MDNECIIDGDRLREWISKRHRQLGTVQDKQRKILINSPWVADNHYHCALVFKGKFGGFRDFKSEKSGSIVDFIMAIDGIGFKDAMRIVSPNGLRTQTVKPRKKQVFEENESRSLALPMDCMDPIVKKGPWWVRDGWDYLVDRGLHPELHEAYSCHSDRVFRGRKQRLSGRVLIPMRDKDGTCVFWTARSVDPQIEPRYLEPPDIEVKVKKEEVVFVPSWKLTNRPTMIVEGSFCAMALFECSLGVLSTQGSILYKEQARQIIRSKARIILAYDRDDPGRMGAVKARRMFLLMGVREIGFIFPPEGHDWSSLYKEYGDREKLRRYVRNNVKLFDDRAEFLLLNTLPSLHGCKRS